MSSNPKPGEIPPGDAPVPAAVVLVGRWGSLRIVEKTAPA
jgi:hypothetical protein